MGQSKSNNGAAICETCMETGPARGKDAIIAGWGSQSKSYKTKNKSPKWFCPNCYVDYLEEEEKDNKKQKQKLAEQMQKLNPKLAALLLSAPFIGPSRH